MKDRSLLGIIPFVVITHVLAILWLVSISTWNPPMPPPKPVIVKTVKLSPPPPPLIAIEESAPLAPPEVKPSPELLPPEVKPSPELKPPEVKPSPPLSPPPVKSPAESKPPAPKPKIPPPKKQTTPPPKPIPKTPPPPKPMEPPAPTPAEIAQKAAQAKQRNLLSQAKEKMGKINKNPGSIAQEISLATPGKIESLHIDALVLDGGAALNAKESAYRDELAYRLKLLLKLPKYGEVKLRLTVERSGQAAKIAMISFQSEENKTYLESALPKLKLPAFGTNFPGQEEYTFTITLSNES
jgi:colicin import membrane protein